jgi:hypothetical protein
MSFKVLFVGDVVGKPGCRVLSQKVPALKRKYDLDCIIANVENAAGGSGLTPNLYEKIRRYGVNLMTMGDHVYRRREIIPVLEKSSYLARPANLPAEAPGKGLIVYESPAGAPIAVVTLLGRLFMKPQADCPFHAVDRTLATLSDKVKMIVVDVHAEATSEKVALGWHLDGRVSLVVGTHTHVQTADERVLPKGTGYISDLGMTGPYDGVLGRCKERVLQSAITAWPTPFRIAQNDIRLCGLFASLDAESGRCLNVERVVEPLDEDAGDDSRTGDLNTEDYE